MKTALIYIGCFILSIKAYAQVKKVYGRSFDYKSLSLTDTLRGNKLPNYYVCCSYINGELSDVDVFRKEEWMKEYLQTHARVLRKDGYTFFIYDPGKAKVGGYGKVFSKKTKFSDTAMLRNDTIIFKQTNQYRVQLHYAISIFSDTIIVEDKIFPTNNKKQFKNSTLFSFSNYTQWPLLTNYSRFYQITITPKKNDVVRAKRMIDDGMIDYSDGYLHTNEYFQKRGIAATLFWAKHLGIVY
jgi:hypothetical protein